MTGPIMTEAQLRAAMTAPEQEHLEYKAARHRFPREDLCRYCVALSNEGGGSLVLGVSDRLPRQIVGTDCFSDLNDIKKRLLDTLNFRVDVHEISTEEGRVVTFYCPGRPVGTPRDYHGQYLMRSGESLVPMTADVLARIINESETDHSRTLCEGATFADLSPDAIAEFRAHWTRKSGSSALNNLSDSQLLEDARLLDGGRITKAAMILLGRKESLSRLLQQTELVFEYRQDSSLIEHQDRVEYRAGFFLWINDLWNRINARNQTYSIRDGLFRYDVPAFNEDVVREGLLNAVAHRDYREAGSIFVRQYPDRLEITSPGGFPRGVTVDNIIYQQNPRNRLVSEALQFCGLVERSGQGADRMFRVSIEEGKNRPDYSGSDEHHVVLLLDGQVRDSRFVEYLNRLASERNMTLLVEDFLILDKVRRGEAAQRDHRERLDHLVDQGIIERVGRGRGVKYLLSQGLYKHVGEAGTYTRHRGLDEDHNRQLVLTHIRNSGSAGATITEFQQVLPNKSRSQINALLKRMKRSGLIKTQGKTKAARWFLDDGAEQ